MYKLLEDFNLIGYVYFGGSKTKAIKGLEVLSQIIKMLESGLWPSSNDSNSNLYDDDSNKPYKLADYALDNIIKFDVKGKKVLDYGCGEGHLVTSCMSRGAEAHGYDRVLFKNGIWLANELNFTNYWLKSISNGPYDFIMCYDVLDHSAYPIDDLLKIKSVLAPRGLAFIRCHPICSRHGGHIQKYSDKAFAHLVFTTEELKSLDIKLPAQRIIYPLVTYEDFIKKAGLKINSRNIITSPVEAFFKSKPLIAKRINEFFNIASSSSIPEFQMSQSYVDYVVSKA